MRKILISTLFASAAINANADEDISKGAKLFQKCRSCHLVQAPSIESASVRTGPNLYAIKDRVVGSVEEFAYSKNLIAAREEGAVWDEALMDAFLENPRTVYPKTKMSYAGMPDPEDRRVMIAFLFSLNEESAAEHQDPEVAPDILAIEGDVDYGEYLSSSCITCHQADGGDTGIPSIIGWPVDQFVTTMHAYKNKDRDNPVMQQYAGSLSDDEIAALAAYFETLDAE